jgi:precorrin-2/cobalt-factor-2 C20-methyltransferase
MKPGMRRAAILNVLANAGRSGDANYIEYAGQSRQKIVKDVSLLDDGPGPYFSLFLVNRQRDYR